MQDTDAQTRRFLLRARDAAKRGDVLPTTKADEEMADMGWEREDLLQQIAALQEEDFLRTERSRYDDHAVMWVFCPPYWDGSYLWLRLVERGAVSILVVSIHPAGGDPWSS